jgi:hypothetical protein
MKTWWVEYRERNAGRPGGHRRLRGYIVVAEDDELAGQSGYENLENDMCEFSNDTTPSAWSIESVALVEACVGCGGYRKVVAPAGEGAVS